MLTGSTRLDRIGAYVGSGALHASPMLLFALGLLLVGFAFKISAVPFHMWTPDAYEGAPTLVTGFMSTGVKAAAFAAFARVFLTALGRVGGDWVPGASRRSPSRRWCVGTVVGVAQANLKRMLAYSSIAHAGYLLVALVAAQPNAAVGKASILFYLLVYAVTNLGAFGVIALLGHVGAGERSAARLRGPLAEPPGAGGADDGVPAVARRVSADGRLHREVVRLQRRRAARATTRWPSSAC